MNRAVANKTSRSASLRPFIVNGEAVPRPLNGKEYTPTEAIDILIAANEIGIQEALQNNAER